MLKIIFTYFIVHIILHIKLKIVLGALDVSNEKFDEKYQIMLKSFLYEFKKLYSLNLRHKNILSLCPFIYF